MMRSASSGFLLPATLVLAAGLLLLATTFLETGRHATDLAEQRLLHKQAKTVLRENLAGLRDILENRLAGGGATALTDSMRQGTARMQLITDSRRIPLSSGEDTGAVSSAAFPSAVHGLELPAAWISLSKPDDANAVSIAWSAEDLSLMAQSGPPAWWPLPGWSFSPAQDTQSPGDVLDSLLDPGWRALPWISIEEELPFRPEFSPALVPVLCDTALRFGIFATGPAGSRELTVRIRFYLEGRLWNPYNRELRLHSGSGKRAVFRMVFWNLPDLRIHNRSKGLSTGWLSLDSARNDFSGARGMHGFVEMPPLLAAGEELAFIEPDPSHQPEGLARTLHPGFRVGAADSIEIEWRPMPEGIRAGLLPMDADSPVAAAREGTCFSALGSPPLAWPPLTFSRADESPAPFFLHAGSLSFRRDNAQGRISIGNRLIESHFADPRRKELLPGIHFPDATGALCDSSSAISTEVILRPGDPPPPFEPGRKSALFSWPARPPRNLREASDLPHFREGFRIGSADAARLNAIAGRFPWMGASAAPGEVIELPSGGDRESWQQTLTVNTRQPEKWARVLARSSRSASPGLLEFACYPSMGSGRETNFIQVDDTSLQAAIEDHCKEVAMAPFSAIGDLFNAGFLDSLDPAGAGVLSPLLPMRGYLRDAPPLVKRGSAWVIHVAVRIASQRQVVYKSARLWLLEKPSPNTGPLLEIIRTEETDPATAVTLHSP